MRAIDITGWHKDDQFSPYPEGSRDKYALFAPANPAENCIVANHRYLMKFSNKRYPVQFWSEIIAAKIGEALGVPVPPCFYAEDIETGQPGSLIEWFYGEAIEEPIKEEEVLAAPLDAEEMPASTPLIHSLYVPGSNYMQRQIADYDMKAGRQHNLKHVGYLLTRFRQNWKIDFWPFWAKLLTFDAIIGNTDRHQDNWGVLWRATVPRFAPAFDNGTSLMHEITEANIGKFNNDEALEKYILKGRHHIRWQINDIKPLPHLELVERLVLTRPQLTPIVRDILQFNQRNLYDDLMGLTEFEAKVPLSKQRIEVICKLVSKRILAIKKIIDNE